MSLEGQVLCQRIEIGPCALTIVGKPSVAAPAVAAAAPAKNLRRETASGFLVCSLLIESSIGKAVGCGCLGVILLGTGTCSGETPHWGVLLRRRPTRDSDP